MDLSAPADNLRAFLKARASLDGADAVTWFEGNAYAWIPGEASRPLFGFEGYNVARAVEAEGGYDLLSREAVFYLDATSREIVDRWPSPFTGEDAEVLHIFNDPVNLPFRLDGPRGPFRAPVSQIEDELIFAVDVFLAYPSPLPRAEFPAESQSDLYQAAELFQFFCARSDVLDPATTSAACRVSWTRLGPWLPWMKMGDRPGTIVYHGRGAKLAGGYAALPARIRAAVEAHDPVFASAPETFTQPNETSWTYYKKTRAGTPARG